MGEAVAVESPEWAVVVALQFGDAAGPSSVMCVLGFNTRAECERAVERIPADAMPYFGPRLCLGATLIALPADELTRA